MASDTLHRPEIDAQSIEELRELRSMADGSARLAALTAFFRQRGHDVIESSGRINHQLATVSSLLGQYAREAERLGLSTYPGEPMHVDRREPGIANASEKAA